MSRRRIGGGVRRTSSTKTRSRGILTGAKAAFWPTLAALVSSCLEAKVEISVVDCGLRLRHRRWLASKGVSLLPAPCDIRATLSGLRRRNRGMSDIAAWLKPAICLNSPYEDTVWIDADAVVTRDHHELFRLLDEGSWVASEKWVDSADLPDLYRDLLQLRLGGAPAPFAQACKISTGAFGFRRDDEWLASWRDVCAELMQDVRALPLCRCRDQSALVMMYCSALDLEMPRVIDDDRFNYPANGLKREDRFKRKRYPLDANLLSAVRDDHPHAIVVHWMGRPKVWEIEHEQFGKAGLIPTVETNEEPLALEIKDKALSR